MKFPITNPKLLFSPKTLRQDVTSGVVTGVASIPDGLASGILAGVNPVAGLYGHLFGQLGGALFTSTTLMTVQATGAMAIIVSDVDLGGTSDPERALFTLSIMTGIIMLAAGLLRAGSILRFVSRSVMVGFITAVGVNIILGQLGDLTEYSAEGLTRIDKTFNLLLHIFDINFAALGVGVASIAMIVILQRTPLGELGLVLAVILGSALAIGFNRMGWDVLLLRDIADVPAGLPLPVLPSLSDVIDLLLPAVSLAFLGLVQGAGVSSALVNPDGHKTNPSQDFVAQGAANILSGVFRGMPVGASMGSSSLTQTSGGKSRGAILISSVIMIIGIVVFGQAVQLISMPTLAGLLIVVGWGTIKPRTIRAVAAGGMVPRAVMTITFILTLLIPLQYAVLVGVAISALLFIVTESSNLTIRRIVWQQDGRMEEVDPPEVLGAGEVVTIQPYGAIFFASSDMLRKTLPKISKDCAGSVVILRLRGLDEAGATFLTMLTDLANELHDAGSKLMIVTDHQRVVEQLEDGDTMDAIGLDNVYVSSPILGEQLRAAYEDALHWVQSQGITPATPIPKVLFDDRSDNDPIPGRHPTLPDRSGSERSDHPGDITPKRETPNPHDDKNPDSWPVERMAL